MHEVLTLAHGQRTGHLAAHFYNQQDVYVDYTDWKHSQNDTQVHFKQTFRPTTLDFTPRVLLWDLNGGYGALGQYEYEHVNEHQHENEGNGADVTLTRRRRIPKSAYQTALDMGTAVPTLNTDNTLYWSDYSRVIYEPKSFNVLQHWEFDPVDYPEGRLALGQQKQFKGFDVGVNEWKDVGVEYMEDKYRVSLEECDLLNGINVLTELDSSWGGFTSEMVKALRDDYNPKSSLITWAQCSNDIQGTKGQLLDRIRAFVELQRSSSLLIPLKIMDESMWTNGALQCLPFDSFQTLNSENTQSVNFHALVDSLTLGTNRHLITNVSVKHGNKEWEFGGLFANRSSMHQFSELGIHRPSTSGVVPTNISDDRNNRNTTTEYTMKQAFTPPDSFPQDFISANDTLSVSFTTSSSTRNVLHNWRQLVGKYARGDDREELADELDTLAERFSHGWSDDEDYD